VLHAKYMREKKTHALEKDSLDETLHRWMDAFEAAVDRRVSEAMA
jgi:hypothetical protein